jgi:hypothetical protein
MQFTPVSPRLRTAEQRITGAILTAFNLRGISEWLHNDVGCTAP